MTFDKNARKSTLIRLFKSQSPQSTAISNAPVNHPSRSPREPNAYQDSGVLSILQALTDRVANLQSGMINLTERLNRHESLNRPPPAAAAAREAKNRQPDNRIRPGNRTLPVNQRLRPTIHQELKPKIRTHWQRLTLIKAANIQELSMDSRPSHCRMLKRYLQV